MKIRLFGSENCEKCKIMQLALIKEKIPYLFVDANDEEKNGVLMDQRNIDELPHILIESDDGKMVFQNVGFIPAKKIKEILNNY